MEKKLIYSYNPEADELNVSFGKAKEAISAEIKEDIYINLSPKTKKVVGFTLLNFLEHIKQNQQNKQELFSVPLHGQFTVPQATYKKFV